MGVPNEKDEDVFGVTQLPEDFKLPELDVDLPIVHTPVKDEDLGIDLSKLTDWEKAIRGIS